MSIGEKDWRTRQWHEYRKAVDRYKKILIFGYGSIGRTHRKVLSNLISKCEIIFFTNQKNCNYKSINNFRDARLFNPDYIILSKPTNDHEKFAKLIEKNFRKKKVLIEKPAYLKNNRLRLKKNLYFVGYNLRFSPVLKNKKNLILNKKIIDINVVCSLHYLVGEKYRIFKIL